MRGQAHWGGWSLSEPAGDGAPLLLGPDEPPPFEIVNPEGTGRLLLVCDHASNRLPRRLARLGLTDEQLQQHIAWDPGAAALARGLAERLAAPLFLGGYSRLAIDLNRPLESPELIPAQSDGVPVPGNQGLSRNARIARIDALFLPYHQAIARWLDAHPDPGLWLISLHSFTPRLAGQWRPWAVGLAYGRDARLAERLRPALAGQLDRPIGDNEPYGIDDIHDFTLPTHAERRGLAHVMIEIRQDELRTPSQIAGWVERLAWAYLRIREDSWTEPPSTGSSGA